MARISYSDNDNGKWNKKNTHTNKKAYLNDFEANKLLSGIDRSSKKEAEIKLGMAKKSNQGLSKALAPKIKKVLLANETFKRWLKEYNPESWDVYAEVAPYDYDLGTLGTVMFGRKDKLPKKIAFGVKAMKNGKEESPDEAYASAIKMDSAPRYYEIRGGKLVKSDKALASDILKTINTAMQAHGLFSKNYSVNTNINEEYTPNYFPY